MPNRNVFAHCIQGADHIKRCQPCQDFSASHQNEKVSVVAVADGHGSPQYFRSHVGSKFAVETAMKAILAFTENQDSGFSELGVSALHTKLKQLASHIIGAWQESVDQHQSAFPLCNDSKFGGLEAHHQKGYLNNPKPHHVHQAYGTTLIAAAFSENYWFGFQIGDGKCLALYEDGTWHQPIPWDSKCYLNVTTSICDTDALWEFRYWFGYESTTGELYEFTCGPERETQPSIRKTFHRPIAVFMGSDGVDDSFTAFENDKQLENLYRSIFVSHAKEGFESLNVQIRQLAEKMAHQGSRDDVSMAGILSMPSDGLVKLFALQEKQEANEKKRAECQKEIEAKKKRCLETKQEMDKISLHLAGLEAEYQQEQQRLSSEIRPYIAHLQLARGKCKNPRKTPTNGVYAKTDHYLLNGRVVNVSPNASHSLKEKELRKIERELQRMQLLEEESVKRLKSLSGQINDLKVSISSYRHLLQTIQAEWGKVRKEFESLELEAVFLERSLREVDFSKSGFKIL